MKLKKFILLVLFSNIISISTVFAVGITLSGPETACHESVHEYEAVPGDTTFSNVQKMWWKCENCTIWDPLTEDWIDSIYRERDVYGHSWLWTVDVQFSQWIPGRDSAKVTVIIHNGNGYKDDFIDVTFGPPPGAAAIIMGSNVLDNCIETTNNYSLYNVGSGWSLNGTNWTGTSYLSLTNIMPTSVTVGSSSSTYSGQQTLTAPMIYKETGLSGSIQCGTENITKSISVTRDKPTYHTQEIDDLPYSPGQQVVPGSHRASAEWNGEGITSYSWQVQSGISYYTAQNVCNFTMPSSGYSSIWLYGFATNGCGITDYPARFTVTLGSGGARIASIYPNPSVNELTVETKLEKRADHPKKQELIADEILILDMLGKIVHKSSPTESVTKITKNLPKGKYIMHIKFKDEVIKRHIFIE